MARTREFDPHAALQTAIKLFWEEGYRAASVDNVVQRSGVAKYGIYGTFGTKRELFRKALEQYALDRRQDIQRPIRKPAASLPEILTFFRDAPKLATRGRRGCLVANSGVELGAKVPEIREFVRRFFGDVARVLQDCLRRAVARGEVDASIDVAATAQYLATEFRMALILAASGESRRDIERHLEMALRVLA